MISLPDEPAPNGLGYALLDFGLIQRGAASLRVDRPGSRYRLEVSYPPMRPDTARKFLARLQRAKRKGLKMELPLLGVSQGIPGTPVIDGAGQAGASIALTGLTPAYVAKEGFWLTISEADGTAYLHQVAETAVADGSGDMVVEIEPPLRAPFADGDSVELARPFVQGFVDGESLAWSVAVERLIAPSFVLEEFA